MIKFEKGKRYNQLVLLKDLGKIRNKKKWLCKCDCGKQKSVDASSVRAGSTKSCGCLRLKRFEENAQKSRIPRLPYGHGLGNSLLSSYASRARKKNLKFELTREEFRYLINQDCHYCGTPPSNHKSYNKPSSKEVLIYNGIDRKDNRFGYITSNVVPCCGRCNTLKMALTLNEFFGLIKKIYVKHNLQLNKGKQ